MLDPTLEKTLLSRDVDDLLVLQWTRCPGERLEKSAAAHNELKRASVARHPETPPGIKRRLLDDRSATVRSLAHDGMIALDAIDASPAVRFWTLFDIEDAELVHRDIVGVIRLGLGLAGLAAAGELVESPGHSMGPFLLGAVASDTPESVLAVLAEHPMTLLAALVAYRFDLPSSIEWKLLTRQRSSSGRAHVHAVLARRTRSPNILEKLAMSSNEEVLSEVIGNPCCPPHVLDALGLNAPRDRLRALACAYRLPPSIAVFIKGRLDYELNEILWNHPGSTAEVLDELTRDERFSWAGALEHRNISAATLARVAVTGNAECRGIVARNAKTPPEVLARLAEEQDVTVLFGVLQSPHCPSEVAARLSHHEDPGVVALTARYALSAARFAALATSDHREIVMAVAKSRHCPAHVLAELAQHPTKALRIAVAENKVSSQDTLSRLTQDEDEVVRRHALSNPACPVVMLEAAAKSTPLQGCVARNPSTPVAVLEKLAESPAPHVLDALAANPACPSDLLERIHADPHLSRQGLENLVRNPQTPPSLLHSLRDALPEESLEELIERATRVHPSDDAFLSLRERLCGGRAKG